MTERCWWQFRDEYRQLLDRLELDEGLGRGHEDQLIWLLWHQKEEAFTRLREWETALREMNVCHGNAGHALRVPITSLASDVQLYDTIRDAVITCAQKLI